jgi:carboxymethylenebutenolidase
VLPENAGTVLAGGCPVGASNAGRDRALRRTATRPEQTLTRLRSATTSRSTPTPGTFSSTATTTVPLAILEKVAGLNYHEPPAEDAWARILHLFEANPRSNAPSGGS